jgi:CelD/BcsL family acetyltransferase involved in cellulose biosynthesis
MTAASPYKLRFQIGARTLLTARRRLIRVALTLEDVLSGRVPALPPPAAAAHGYVINSLPEALLPAVVLRTEGLRPFVRQRYTRYHADLTLGFDAYLARFSARSRATLLRKLRRFAARSGGTVDIRAYRTAEEYEAFFARARVVSRKSYQERLLDAGLPVRDKEDMLARAARDGLRAFLLFLDGEPVSYLQLAAEGDTLIYAYLGFDPALAHLSPGTVLQLEAVRLLMEEGRFRRLDFTEGEGQHKRLFATGGVRCIDLLLLRPSLANLACATALDVFDRCVAGAKALMDRPALRPLARALRR